MATIVTSSLVWLDGQYWAITEPRTNDQMVCQHKIAQGWRVVCWKYPAWLGTPNTTVVGARKNFGYKTTWPPRAVEKQQPSNRLTGLVGRRVRNGTHIICAHRLKGKVGTLSRCKYGFDSRWVYHQQYESCFWNYKFRLWGFYAVHQLPSSLLQIGAKEGYYMPVWRNGRRVRLRSVYRKVCRFKSYCRHQRS